MQNYFSLKNIRKVTLFLHILGSLLSVDFCVGVFQEKEVKREFQAEAKQPAVITSKSH